MKWLIKAINRLKYLLLNEGRYEYEQQLKEDIETELTDRISNL